MFRMITGCDWPYWAYCYFGTTCQYGHVVSQYDRAFHSRGQHLCKYFGTKEIFYLRKGFNSHRAVLEHQRGRRFLVLGHQYGCHDVNCKTT